MKFLFPGNFHSIHYSLTSLYCPSDKSAFMLTRNHVNKDCPNDIVHIICRFVGIMVWRRWSVEETGQPSERETI